MDKQIDFAELDDVSRDLIPNCVVITAKALTPSANQWRNLFVVNICWKYTEVCFKYELTQKKKKKKKKKKKTEKHSAGLRASVMHKRKFCKFVNTTLLYFDPGTYVVYSMFINIL